MKKSLHQNPKSSNQKSTVKIISTNPAILAGDLPGGYSLQMIPSTSTSGEFSLIAPSGKTISVLAYSRA